MERQPNSRAMNPDSRSMTHGVRTLNEEGFWKTMSSTPHSGERHGNPSTNNSHSLCTFFSVCFISTLVFSIPSPLKLAIVATF